MHLGMHVIKKCLWSHTLHICATLSVSHTRVPRCSLEARGSAGSLTDVVIIARACIALTARSVECLRAQGISSLDLYVSIFLYFKTFKMSQTLIFTIAFLFGLLAWNKNWSVSLELECGTNTLSYCPGDLINITCAVNSIVLRWIFEDGSGQEISLPLSFYRNDHVGDVPKTSQTNSTKFTAKLVREDSLAREMHRLCGLNLHKK